MKKLSFLLFTYFLSQSFVFAAPYDHIHLTADSAQEAVNWYVKHFGGTASRFQGSMDTSLPIDRVKYGDISVIFFDRAPTAGSVGSSADHFSFSMPNVDQVVAQVVADGGTQLGEIIEFSGMKIGFVEDPWGTKLELIDDPNLRGMHHLHLSSPNPEQTLAWYASAFGGENKTFAGALPGLHYGDIWLFVAAATGELAATQGRSFDHLGWKFDDLDAAAQTLRSQGIEFTMEPRDFRNIRIAFVEGPDGVRIELVQP